MCKRYWFGVGALVAFVLAAGDVLAGDLTPPGPPGPTMSTLEEIYQKQVDTFLAVTGDPNVVNTTSGNAVAGEILGGKKAWVQGQEVTGTMPNVGQTNITPGSATTAIPRGYHSGTGTVLGDADLIPGNIRAGVNLFGVGGKTEVVDTESGDALAGDVMAGKKAWVDGAEVTGTMATRSLSDTTTTIEAGYYASTTLNAVDTDLAPENIKKDVTIFGVTGTQEGGDGTTLNAGVPKTGQTVSYLAGDDGNLEKGVSWPNPRFTDNSDGTVTDNLTGLIWLKNANAFGDRNWGTALNDCATLNSGEHGLSDGSIEGDWRLPNVRELQSLIDYGRAYLALPSSHPFENVQGGRYCTSTWCAAQSENVWYVYMGNGAVGWGFITDSYPVWPVRGGQ